MNRNDPFTKMKTSYCLLLVCIVFSLITSCTNTKKEFYPSGAIRSEINTKSGNYQGQAMYYYETGAPMMSCNYKDNKLDGSLMRYYQSGYRKELQTYKGGIMNGVRIDLPIGFHAGY